MKQARNTSDILPIACFTVSCLWIGVLYGILAVSFNVFPVPAIQFALGQLDAVFSTAQQPDFLSIPGDGATTRSLDGAAVSPGLILVTGLSEDLLNFARVVDRSGAVVHEWRPNWFELPSGALRLPDDGRRPQSAPGATLHGAAVLSNGDLVFNFDHLATVRLDVCGNARWMLDNLGHHSVELDAGGDLWIPAERFVARGDETGFANHEGPLRDWTIQKVDRDGKILRTISVVDILTRNDLLGLLHLSNLDNRRTDVRGDTLHVNDVEVFPPQLEEGVFKHGDLMISLRNINTVMVVDPESLQTRYRTTGMFLRQHDPDFVSGDRLTVFDNRNLTPNSDPATRRSRILEIDAARDTAREIFVPRGNARFFTDIMGKHQKLPNGNMLITAAWEGRAIEVAPDGTLVWEYVNAVSGGARGLITEATLLPPTMSAAFFEQQRHLCGHRGASGELSWQDR